MPWHVGRGMLLLHLLEGLMILLCFNDESVGSELLQYDAPWAPAPQELETCYASKLQADHHDTLTDHHLHPTYHSVAAHTGGPWGSVHVTPWSQWTDPTGQHHEFSACTPAGQRSVSVLNRHRHESMHTSFVPSLDYNVVEQLYVGP